MNLKGPLACFIYTMLITGGITAGVLHDPHLLKVVLLAILATGMVGMLWLIIYMIINNE